MMSIKVSSKGLTRCPSCSAHIQVAERIESTVCPFCNAELPAALKAASRRTGPLNHLLGTGRSAVIAASLLGLPVAACDDGDSGPVDTPDVAADASDDVQPAPVYGFPADAFPDDIGQDAAPETVSEAVYGMPADPDASGPGGVDADAVGPDVADEPPMEPVYGMPAEPRE